MGKTSSYPAYTGGTVNVNGQTKSALYKRGNNIVSDYNMSDTEKQIYDYAQKSFADSLSKVNVFDENTQRELKNQLNAYTRNGQKIIDDIYTPMLNNLKSDIASRFGNYDNSAFLDKLDSIESKRADSMSGLAQDILAKGDELKKNELADRYTYLGFLQDIQSQVDSNILNYINAARQNSSSGNNYNASSYRANNSLSNDNWSTYANLAASTALMFL
ncbi:hypothetical protein J6P92_00960 [bacterium]|nr:hypothetical protein [bacterium]